MEPGDHPVAMKGDAAKPNRYADDIVVVIVTGSRHYNSAALIRELDELERASPRFQLFVGNASGADAIARKWARARSRRASGGRVTYFFWREFGNPHGFNARLAGQFRNGDMVQEASCCLSGGGRVVCLVAGTGRVANDCAQQCRDACFEVYEVR